MKNKYAMKRMLVCLLTAVLLFGSAAVSASAKPHFPFREEYKTANEVAEIVWNAYSNGDLGPILVVQGKLKQGWTTKDVYVVALAGTENGKGQTTNKIDALLAGMQYYYSPYVVNVINVIKNNIPKGSNLMLLGHSLGGMTCQMVASHNDVKQNYNILNTVTFGAPVIMGGFREGKVQRLGDSSDFVPYLSITGQLLRQVAGLNREDGGFSKGGWTFDKGWDAHNQSYIREDLWGKYDVTGVKYGRATLTVDASTVQHFSSPNHCG